MEEQGEEDILEGFQFSKTNENPYREDPAPQPRGKSDSEDLDPEEPVPVVPVSLPCTCGNCPQMEMERENVCCRSELRWQKEFNTEGQYKCLVELPNYMNVCNVDHFRIVKDMLNSVFYNDDESEDLNRRLRHAAYKSTAFFLRGKMGYGNKLVVPACCKAKIRELCPNPQGVMYVGHKD